MISIVKKILKSEEGFLGITILGIGSIVGIIMLVAISAMFVAAYTKTQAMYDEIGAAMDFAAASASMRLTSGTTDDQEQNNVGIDKTEDEKAREYFNFSLDQVASHFAGEITIQDFYKVNAGDPIPPPRTPLGMPAVEAGTAKQPGYVVYAEVMVWEGGLWNLPPLKIDIKQYRALQAAPLN